MNHSIHLHQHGHRWLKNLQFALGVAVAIGGAAALLSEFVRLLA